MHLGIIDKHMRKIIRRPPISPFDRYLKLKVANGFLSALSFDQTMSYFLITALWRSGDLLAGVKLE